MKPTPALPTKAEFEKWTRKQKRDYKVMYKGKKTNVMDYLAAEAKQLPLAKRKGTEQQIDHNVMLRSVYMKGGFDSVNEYITMIREVTVEQIEDYEKKQTKAKDNSA